MGSVLFDFIPGSSSFRAPGTFFEARSGGSYMSKTATLVLGQRGANGSSVWQDNAPILCATLTDAANLAGVGTPLYESYRCAREVDPAGEIWIAAIPVTGTAATWTVTIGSLPSAAGDGCIEIAGRKIWLTKAASEAASVTATNLAAAINAYVDPLTKAYLPVTATAASNVVTLTARVAGTLMNEIDVTVDAALSGNIFTPALVVVAAGVSGAGTASVSTVLAALGNTVFGMIISPYGDATNVGLAKTALSDAAGRWSYLAQLYGHYASVVTGNTSALTTLGLAQNDRHVSLLGRNASPTPSWEWAAGYYSVQAVWLYDDIGGNCARNQTGRRIGQTIRPPRDRTTWPSDFTTRNSLINSGISTWGVDAEGYVTVDKAVTTSRLHASGVPDIEFSAIQRVFQAMHIFRYWRAALAYKHANKVAADANPGNVAAISTPADVNADSVTILLDLERYGLIENAEKSAKALVVERDAGNSSRFNIGAEVDATDPLDILAASVTFRRAA